MLLFYYYNVRFFIPATRNLWITTGESAFFESLIFKEHLNAAPNHVRNDKLCLPASIVSIKPNMAGEFYQFMKS